MEITVRPADFPLGSVESRAAVRAMIEREEDSAPVLRIVLVHHPPHDCKGRFCISGQRASAVCHVADKELKVGDDGRVFYDVRMKF